MAETRDVKVAYRDAYIDRYNVLRATGQHDAAAEVADLLRKGFDYKVGSRPGGKQPDEKQASDAPELEKAVPEPPTRTPRSSRKG